MKINIVLETNNGASHIKLGDHIHETLKGDQDYIDSNIVLNVDDGDITVYANIDDCKSGDILFEKLDWIMEHIYTATVK